MGSVPGKQRPNSFVETVQVQSAPMEDSPTKHGKYKMLVTRGIYSLNSTTEQGMVEVFYSAKK